MGVEGPEVANGAPVPLEPFAGDVGLEQAYASVVEDPQYRETLGLIQQARWADAEGALAELEARYPGDAELVRAQHELALHLSAERTWFAGAPTRRDLLSGLRPQMVRVLIAGNLVLYALVAMTWLLLRLRQLFH